MTRFAVDHLVLVRHAMPVERPDVPSSRWPLSDEGRADARELKRVLQVPRAYYVASDETKAAETLGELAGDNHVVSDPRFGEVHKPFVESDYRSVARSYVEGTCPEGWEPHEEVIARFDAAVVHHATHAAQAGLPLVIGTHGMAPTIWLTDLVDLHPDPGGFWEALRFPDAIQVDLPARTAQTLLTS